MQELEPAPQHKQGDQQTNFFQFACSTGGLLVPTFVINILSKTQRRRPADQHFPVCLLPWWSPCAYLLLFIFLTKHNGGDQQTTTSQDSNPGLTAGLWLSVKEKLFIFLYRLPQTASQDKNPDLTVGLRLSVNEQLFTFLYRLPQTASQDSNPDLTAGLWLSVKENCFFL